MTEEYILWKVDPMNPSLPWVKEKTCFAHGIEEATDVLCDQVYNPGHFIITIKL